MSHLGAQLYQATLLFDSDKSPEKRVFNRRTKLLIPVGKLLPTFAEETCRQVTERQRKYKTVHERI